MTAIFEGSIPPYIVDAFVSLGKPVVASYEAIIVQSCLGATSNTASAVAALIAPLPNCSFVPLRVVLLLVNNVEPAIALGKLPASMSDTGIAIALIIDPVAFSYGTIATALSPLEAPCSIL
ncbi:MAG: hypothetical protein WA144_08200 [Candidatus Methanoperedens sp.]